MTASILIIEDQFEIRNMISFTIKSYGFNTYEAIDSNSAFTILNKKKIDLVLVDWMLPDESGIQIIKKIRNYEKHLPIIMLTAKSEEADKILGLEVGADDYITKPFSPKELMARIKALLRRSSPENNIELVSYGSVSVDPSSHIAKEGESIVLLGPTEFKLLLFFVTHPERVYSRAQILDLVWGRNIFVEERTVDVHILRLRNSFKTDVSKYIKTIRGSGYIFSNK